MHRKHLFRPFWNLDYSAIPDLTGPDLERDSRGLIPERGRGRLLLGRYSEADIRERFEHYSVATTLATMGFGDYEIQLNASDREQQELFVWPLAEGKRTVEPLAEMILREVMLAPDPALLTSPRPFAFLVIQWLRLQNPTQRVPMDELLPGQRYPGLGLGRKVIEMLVALVERCGLEGIVNRPEFLHNAWLYSPHFRYLDPVAEGRLGALKRDLGEHSLWTIAWAAQRGVIREDGERMFFRWYQGEQLLPNCRELKAYFSGARYRQTMAEVMAQARYELLPGSGRPGAP